MTMTSTPFSSPSFRPRLQSPFSSSSSPANPWNLNPSGPLPTPFMEEPSSWPPLPSSSQMHATVTASATADPEATADVPAVAVEAISYPSPVTAPECDPIPDQERTALPEESDAAPRHSSARDPNHQRNSNRHNNRRPQQGRGRDPHFFHSGNGGKFYRPPPPYWNPAFGFGPIWPPHPPAGAPSLVPLFRCPMCWYSTQ